MSDFHTSDQREVLGSSAAKIERKIEYVSRTAKGQVDKDPNGKQTLDMANMNVLSRSKENENGFADIQSQLISILGKIAKKYPKFDLKSISPDNLPAKARESGVSLNTSEIIALTRLSELCMDPQNPNTKQLYAAWGATIEKAENARLGFTEKYLKRLKQKPGETILLTMAGAAGVYLGLQVIGWLVGKTKEKVKGKISSFFTPGRILTALGISAIGAYMGRGAFKDWLYKKLGFKEDLDKFQAIIDKLKKAKNPEEVKKWKKKAEELAKKFKEAPSEIKGKAVSMLEKGRRMKEEGPKWFLASKILKREVTTKEKERCTKLSQFIKGLDTGLEIDPELLAIIGNQKYEDFIKKEPGLMVYLSDFYHLFKGKEKATVGKKIVLNYGSGHLIDFFTRILKNKGEFDDFKGKTIYEVLELLEKKPNKYLDQHTLKKAQEGNIYAKRALKDIEAAFNDSEKAKDKKFWHRLLANAARGGITFVFNTMKEGSIWILKNGYRIATIENNLILGTLHTIADELVESKSYSSKALGYYLYVGGYCAAIGAPIGSALGLARGVMKYRGMTFLLKDVAGGTLTGIKRGLTLPVRAIGGVAKGVLWDWPIHKQHPFHSLQRYWDQHRFILEDLKMGWVGSLAGSKTFSEKIMSGEIKVIDDGLLRKLGTYKTLLEKQKTQISKLVAKGKYEDMYNRYDGDIKRIERILEIMGKRNKRKRIVGIDETKWGRAVDSLFGNFDETQRNILKSNKRLGLMLLEQELPLSQEIFRQPKLIELLNKNNDLLDALTRERGLINDPKIQEVLKTGDTAKMEEAIKERAKAWESMRRKEKKAISEAEEKSLAGEKISEEFVKTSEGKYRFMGEEFAFTEEQIKAEAAKFNGDTEKAAKSLCEQQWNEPRQISEMKGRRIYRYRGGEFMLAEAEYAGKSAEQIKLACEAKFAEVVGISDIRTNSKGLKEYKIRGQWIELAEDPKTIEEAKTRCIEELKKSGKPFDIKIIEQSKLLKYFRLFEKVGGAAVAAGIIYHLETAQDKRVAVAETTMGLGAFMGGFYSTELTFGRFFKHPVAKGILDIMGGVAATFGLQGTIKEIIEKYWPKFAGVQQMSVEGAAFMEKLGVRQVTRMGLVSLEKGLLKKGMEKAGLKAVTELLGKQIESKFIKKVGQFASKSLTKKLAISLGARGVAMAGLLADDATVIGVLDDVVAVGMAVWMAKDIYDVVQLGRKALKIKGAMEKYGKIPIADIQPATEIDKKALEAELVKRGKSLESMSNDEIMNVIHSMPDIRLKITRSGMSGYEEYRFVKGEVWSTTIMTEEGEKLELTDEELNKQITLPPPKEFKTWEIDYSAPKEKLLANYRLALFYTKAQCGWTKMDHRLLDDKTIVLKRLDSGETITIKRSGKTWSVENYKSGLSLFQAAAMANLLGHIKGVIRKEGYEGGSSHPFELDGNDIDFDKKGSPIDLTILEGDTGWLGFYNKIGLDKKTVVDTLNKWYSTS